MPNKPSRRPTVPSRANARRRPDRLPIDFGPLPPDPAPRRREIAEPAWPVERPVFLTVEEVAELLRVCRTTVYTLIGNRAENRFPASKVGGSYRIRVSELDGWLASNAADGDPTAS